MNQIDTQARTWIPRILKKKKKKKKKKKELALTKKKKIGVLSKKYLNRWVKPKNKQTSFHLFDL
jgi:hypothetical protein